MSNEKAEEKVVNKSDDLKKQVANLAFTVRKIKDWLEGTTGADIDGDGRIGSGPYNKVKKMLTLFFMIGFASFCLAGPHNTNLFVVGGTEAAPLTYIDQSGNVHAPGMAINNFTVTTNTTVSGTVLVDGNLTVNTNVGIGGTLTVTGVSTFVSTPVLKNGLSVGTNATVGGTLAVTGVVTLTATPLLKDGLNVRTNVIIGGTLTATGAITGPISAANLTAGTLASAINGASITNMGADKIASGTLDNARLDADLQAVALNNGGSLTNLSAANLVAGTIATAIDGSAVTNLNASSLASGTVPNARLDSDLQALALNNGNGLTNLSSVNLLPGEAIAAVNGAAITNLGADKLASGTVDNARLDADLQALALLNGTGLTNMSAAGLLAGTIAPAIDVSGVTNGNATTLFGSGTVPDARLSANLQAASLNNGAGFTNLSAANLVAGTIASAIDLSAGTNISASALASGTVPNARLSSALQAYSLNNGGSITNVPEAGVVLGANLTKLNLNDGGSLTNVPEAGVVLGANLTKLNLNNAGSLTNVGDVLTGTLGAKLMLSNGSSLTNLNPAGFSTTGLSTNPCNLVVSGGTTSTFEFVNGRLISITPL